MLLASPRAGRDAFTVLGALIVGLLALRGQHLYRGRVCAVRSVEMARTASASLMTVCVVWFVGELLGRGIRFRDALLGGTLACLLVTVSRGGFARWLRTRRRAGDLCRRILLVGTGNEAHGLADLLAVHPEVGLRIVGAVGPGRRDLGSIPWCGPLETLRVALERSDADGVLLAAGDLGAEELNRITRELSLSGVHIHLSNGLQGIANRRLRSLPVAYEPLFYLEPAELDPTRLLVKRAIDITIAVVLLLLAAPLLAVAAFAIHREDDGPILFRQTRIGRRGRPFVLFKLRTMVPDAEERLIDLTLRNERRQGPLFKLASDPRRTRIGRILERTSFDELPQLINVLRGDMSLVGPRPALPHEVAQFEMGLLGRHAVAPGITGLWQVEGRENPAFDVYRRLDLFYVENWSIGLDLIILSRTLGAVAGRLLPRR